MPELKIVYYSPHPTHDIVSEVGYSTHQRETIAAMRALGHTVEPVILGGTEKKDVQQYHEALTERSNAKKWLRYLLPKALINALKDYKLIRHDTRAAMMLEATIKREKPDLVYERNEYMQDKGTMLCRRLGVTHYLEINSPCVEEMRSFEGPSLLHFVGMQKERRKVQNTNRIFVVSSVLKDYVNRHFGPVDGMEVIPNCIDPEKEIPEAGEMELLRKALQISTQKVFGFVGSIFPYHGVEKLIRAYAVVVKNFPDTRLVVVGGGALLAEYQRLAAEILPSDSFVFTGKIPHKEVMKYIGIFDVAMMPDSNWYGSPVKILEYGLMKKIIIAPNNGPLNDLMVHGVDGILVEPGQKALEDAMEYVLKNQTEVQSYGPHFCDKILTHFTWKKQAEKILSGLRN